MNKQRDHLEMGVGGSPTHKQWVGQREEKGYRTVQLKMPVNSVHLKSMHSWSSAEPTFYVWPFQRKTPWETESHTQPKRL